MRVGVFVGSQPPDAGGGFVFSWEILRALCELAGESRHQFTVLAEPAAAGYARSLSQRVKVAEIARPGTVARVKEALWRHSSVARAWLPGPGWLQRRADELGLEFLWFLSPSGHFLDTPYAAIVWDLQHRTLPWFPEVAAHGQWEIREAIHALFLPRAALVIAGTEVGAREIEASYGVPRSRILLLSHPTPRYALQAQGAAATRAILGLDEPLVVYPAQFWPHKNHAALLRALADLKERHSIRACLALTGSDKGNLAFCKALAASLGVADQVRFLGFVPIEQLIELYRRAVALAYVSFGGPENLPPLEAFALGCPVVAADIPGAREQLGDAALLVDPGSPAAISDALAKLIRTPSLAGQLRERGTARAKQRTAESFVRGMLAWLDRFAALRAAWPGPRGES